MTEFSINEFIKYINTKESYFLNRWGGSDIYILGIFNYYYLKNYNTDKIMDYDDIEYYINYLSKYNGYYDTSNNKSERYNNLILFFNKIKDIYVSNEVNFDLLNFYHNEFGKYFNKNIYLDIKYISYHNICESTYFFSNIILELFKNKKILIISPFCNLIKNQIPKLKYLYNKEINNEFVFLNTFITYFNEDDKIYTNIPHNNFHETVKHYEQEIDKLDFDIALISCGSYAYFIGEKIKTMNKKAFYIGGILQLYFGLYGDGYLKKYFKWFDLNYCELNNFDIKYSFKTKEMCNTYIYNENKHIHILNTFNYDYNKFDENNKELNYIGAKINFLMKNL